MSRIDFSHMRRRARALDVGRARLDDAERALVVESWRGRMANEYASARVFGELVGQAMRAGVPSLVVTDIARMAAEEVEHGELCAEVLINLDADPTADEPSSLPELPAHEDTSRPVAFVRNVLSVGCASETIAVALVESERAVAITPDLGRVLTRILRDEVGHARLGWTSLRRAVAELAHPEHRAVERYLPTLFQHQIEHYGRFLSLPETTPRAIAAGAPDGRASFRLFWQTLEEVVVPGLERAGLAARPALDIAIDRAAAAAVDRAA